MDTRDAQESTLFTYLTQYKNVDADVAAVEVTLLQDEKLATMATQAAARIALLQATDALPPPQAPPGPQRVADEKYAHSDATAPVGVVAK